MALPEVFEQSSQPKTPQPLKIAVWKLFFERSQNTSPPREATVPRAAPQQPHTAAVHVLRHEGSTTQAEPLELIYSSFIFLVQVATG